jgi:hypothetical protein
VQGHSIMFLMPDHLWLLIRVALQLRHVLSFTAETLGSRV